jgi:hypothetical protein
MKAKFVEFGLSFFTKEARVPKFDFGFQMIEYLHALLKRSKEF